MSYHKLPLPERKRIAPVAHDNKRRELVEWVQCNRETLSSLRLFGTGTTGTMLKQELGLPLAILESGPLGGDQQIGAGIPENAIDFLGYFWDPLEPFLHDPDIKALLRIALVWNIPVACNRTSADFMISLPLMARPYDRLLPHYQLYRERSVPAESAFENHS